VRFTCANNNAYLDYDVAGYKYLTATISIPSDATNAAGNTMNITFFKDGSTTQLGAPFTVALDRPHRVHLNLEGSSQLEIACTASNVNHNTVAIDALYGACTQSEQQARPDRSSRSGR
jgi:hypothetical protein